LTRPAKRAAVLDALFLLALNLWVCGRLLRFEYFNQMGSIEPIFIAMSRWLRTHPSTGAWLDWWDAGLPFVRTYQPLVVHTVAWTARIFGLSDARALHIVAAVGYSLGAVAFYALARTLSARRWYALSGAVLFSLFSPSLLFFPIHRNDTHGVWNLRRFQAIAQYGEVPNVVTLGLVMLALALAHRAVGRRSFRWSAATAVVVALIFSSSIPSTVALAIGFVCYSAAAFDLAVFARLLAIGTTGYLLAAPFALPSTLLLDFANAIRIEGALAPVPVRLSGFALLILVAALTDLLLRRARASFAARFTWLYGLVCFWLVAAHQYWGILLSAQPSRFSLLFEIALILFCVFVTQDALLRERRAMLPVCVILAFFFIHQAINARRFSNAELQPVDIAQTIEYREARWYEANLRGRRVMARGSVQFWLNVFADSPQMVGCCQQSYTNPESFGVDYLVTQGLKNDAETLRTSLLWFRAWAVHATDVSGPKGREYYHDLKFPNAFEGRLPVLWREGDDAIYAVAERAPGVVRIVRSSDLVQHVPDDVTAAPEVERFVAALDDASLPIASETWTNSSDAWIAGKLDPGQVLEVAVNYHSGWHAEANGNPVAVRQDGLGFIAIDPKCEGACQVHLYWQPGTEPVVFEILSGIAAALLALGCVRYA
jgi:hypothetical protein